MCECAHSVHYVHHISCVCGQSNAAKLFLESFLATTAIAHRHSSGHSSALKLQPRIYVTWVP